MRCGDARPGRVVSTTSSTGRRRDSHSRARYRRGRARATRDADEGTSTSALTPEQLREKLASVTRRMERARGREGTFESVERANGGAKTLNDDGDDVDASPTTSAREREGDEGDGLARFGDWLSEVGKSFNAAAKASEDDEGSRATVDGDANANADETRASESREKGWFGEKLEPESQGGWFQWTNGWRVSGESIASATSSWIPNRSVDEGASEGSFDVTAADGIDASSGSDDEDDAKKEGSQQNFLERVPLPPWIRQRVFGVDDGESSSDDEEADVQYYVDDPILTLGAEEDELRELHASAWVLSWRILNIRMAYKKGQFGATVQLLGGTITAAENEVTISVKPETLDEFEVQVRKCAPERAL